jgi:hypothetical protein
MKINREELYNIYMQQVEDIAEECDWVVRFEPRDIVNIISHILETNLNLITHEE